MVEPETASEEQSFLARVEENSNSNLIDLFTYYF